MELSDIFSNLNRLGIVLNFFAGFMLAPELIGIERLRSFENATEANLARLRKKLMLDSDYGRKRRFQFLVARLIALLYVYFLNERFIGPIVLILGISTLTLVPLAFLLQDTFPVMAFLLPYMYILLVLISLPLEYSEKESLIELFRSVGVAKIAVIPIKYCVLFLYYGLQLLISVLSFASYAVILGVVGFFLSTLEGDDKLRSIVVVGGVLFFVLGNALQLIATFSPYS